MGFSRQEYWSRLPVSSSRGIFLTQGLNPRLMFPALAGRFSTISATWEAPQRRGRRHNFFLFKTRQWVFMFLWKKKSMSENASQTLTFNVRISPKKIRDKKVILMDPPYWVVSMELSAITMRKWTELPPSKRSPGGSEGKASACNAGEMLDLDAKGLAFLEGWTQLQRRMLWDRKNGKNNLVITDIYDHFHFPQSAWHAAVHGAAKSRTTLRNWTELSLRWLANVVLS